MTKFDPMPLNEKGLFAASQVIRNWGMTSGWTTAASLAIRAYFDALPKPAPTYTYGHCANHSQPGGCQLNNLQCGYPDCDRRFAAEVTRTGQEILQKTVESLNEIGVNLMKVKQLEWEDDAQSSYAHSILGPYHIALLPTGWAWNIYRCAKREEAKAAAQRDFDARILSAIHS